MIRAPASWVSISIAVQSHCALDRRLRVKLGRVADLQQHVLHHIAAERALERERPAAEGDIIETPGRCAERARIAGTAVDRVERVSDGPATGVTGRPGFARPGIGRVPVGAQRPVVDPTVRNGVDDLLPAATQHPRGHGGRSQAHQNDVVQPDLVETVRERVDTLDLVGLDRPGQHVANGDRRAAFALRLAAQIIRHRQDGTQVVRRMSPLRRQPGVVEIQPADLHADVVSRLHRIEFPGCRRHPDPAWKHGTRHHRSEMPDALGVAGRQQSTGQRIEKDMPGGVVSLDRIDPVVDDIIGDRDHFRVSVGAGCGTGVEAADGGRTPDCGGTLEGPQSAGTARLRPDPGRCDPTSGGDSSDRPGSQPAHFDPAGLERASPSGRAVRVPLLRREDGRARRCATPVALPRRTVR